jgi:hypothetical protein
LRDSRVFSEKKAKRKRERKRGREREGEKGVNRRVAHVGGG